MEKHIDMNLIADRIIYHLRQLFLEHQALLRYSEETTIELDEMIPGYEEAKNKIYEAVGDKQKHQRLVDAIYKDYIDKYGPIDENGYFVGDKIVLSEQNIEELMSLVRESISTVGFGEVKYESNVSGFVRACLDNLSRSVDLSDNPQKREILEKYLSYMGLRAYVQGEDIGVNIEHSMCSVGHEKMFVMILGEDVSSGTTLLSIGKDGSIEIDSRPVTMKNLTEESVAAKITAGEFVDLGQKEQPSEKLGKGDRG